MHLGVAGGRISPPAESSANSAEFLQKEIETLKDRLDKPVIRVSKVAEAYVSVFFCVRFLAESKESLLKIYSFDNCLD